MKAQKLKVLAQKWRILQSSLLFKYTPHDKQALFHAEGKRFHERLFLAGNRCGKTYCGAMEMAIHLTGLYPSWWQGIRFDKPIRAWAASVTTESTRDILQKVYLGCDDLDVRGAIPQHLVEKVTMRRGVSGAVDTVYVKHSSGGVSLLGFKSYDQGREKFQGTSRHFIHLDEECDIRIYEECLLRTLDVGGSVVLTMTPLKGMTDVCEHFMREDSQQNRTLIQASWEDATHLSENEKERLRQTLRPHEREAREKGIPSLGSGKIYPVKESDIACERFEIPPYFKRVFGIDFGWTNPTAIVHLAHDVENDIVYVTDVYAVCEEPPRVHAQYIQQKYKGLSGVCDPAGRSVTQSDGVSLMQRYADHGVYLQMADNAVESGLMQVLERMQSGRLKIFDDLEPWWREFRLYRRGENGKIVKKNDHLMDAMRYALVSGLPFAKALTPPVSHVHTRPSGWMGL